MGDPKLSKVEKFAAKLRGIKKNSEQNAASGNRMFEGPHFDLNKSFKVIRRTLLSRTRLRPSQKLASEKKTN